MQMQKWEYCVLYSQNRLYRASSGMTSLKEAEKALETEPGQSHDSVALRTIAELGQDGWEMVSASPSWNSVWFKRPIAA